MRAKVALGGSLAAVIVVALIALLSIGAHQSTGIVFEAKIPEKVEGIPVKRATEHAGFRADVSKFPVRAQGKPVEGKKVLRLLGTRIYLNAHPVYPTTEPESSYPGGLPGMWWDYPDEENLVYADLILQGVSHEQALRRTAEYMRTLPKVEKVQNCGLGLITVGEGGPAGRYGMHLHPDWLDKSINLRASRTGERVTPQERAEAGEAFRQVLEGLGRGKVLRLPPGKKFQLVEKNQGKAQEGSVAAQ